MEFDAGDSSGTAVSGIPGDIELGGVFGQIFEEHGVESDGDLVRFGSAVPPDCLVVTVEGSVSVVEVAVLGTASDEQFTEQSELIDLEGEATGSDGSGQFSGCVL